jgi:hypothetical protein
MRKTIILGLAAVWILASATAAPALEKGFLWDGVHWTQISLDGKIGYIFGLGNLADFETASSKGKTPCVSRAFVDDLKNRSVKEVVEKVDKFYQENPGKLKTTVIEVVLRQCTTVCPPEESSGEKKK